MNKQNPLFFGALILFAAVVSMAANLQLQEKGKRQNKNESKEIAEALGRGGYREAARIKGHVVTTMDPNWDLATFDLETLTKRSAAVVVGEASEGTGKLTDDGKVVVTQYDVLVTKPVKGNFRQGNTIQIAMLGGKVEFPDGTSAEIKTPGFEKMSKGKKYLLFLTLTKDSPVLILTGGPQGLFEIAGKQITAFGKPTDAVTKQATQKNSDDFLREIEEYAAKWPNSEGCCKQP